MNLRIQSTTFPNVLRNSNFRIILVCVLLSCLFNVASHPIELEGSPKSSEYKCPPCGCEGDKEIFSTPGSCSYCGMQLGEVSVGVKSTIDKRVSQSLVIGGLGKIYTKLIYPVFAIAIVVSIFFLLINFKTRSQNVFLLGLILTLSLYGFKNQFFAATYSLFRTPFSLFIPISFILLIGPLIFFYTKSLSSDSFKWKKKYWIHFIPSSIMFLYYSVLSILPEELSWQFMFSPYEVRFSHSEQIVAIGLGFIYLFYSHRFLKKTSMKSQIIAWANRFQISMLLLFFVWGALIVINYSLYNFGVSTLSYNPLWVLIALIIGWIFLEVITKPNLLLLIQSSETSHSKTVPALEEELKYLKSGLDADASEKLLWKLEEHLNKSEIFLDPNLTLEKISSELKEYKHHISQVLNSTAGINFYSFINEFRLEKAKKRLMNYRSENKTIEAISFECGFSSKSTFNKLFKQKYGATPSKYAKEKRSDD